MYLIAAAEWKHPQIPEGISASFQFFLRFQYIFCSLSRSYSVLWLLGGKQGRKSLFIYLFIYVYVQLFVSVWQEWVVLL